MQLITGNLIFRVAKEFLQKKVNQITKEQGISSSLLDQYLQNPNLDVKDVLGLAVDLLLAGSDTVGIWVYLNINWGGVSKLEI